MRLVTDTLKTLIPALAVLALSPLPALAASCDDLTQTLRGQSADAASIWQQYNEIEKTQHHGNVNGWFNAQNAHSQHCRCDPKQNSNTDNLAFLYGEKRKDCQHQWSDCMETTRVNKSNELDRACNKFKETVRAMRRAQCQVPPVSDCAIR